MSSVTMPVKVCVAGAADSVERASPIARAVFMSRSSGGYRRARVMAIGLDEGAGPIAIEGIYSPGVIRWAVVVPGFMIQTPPSVPVSGSPSDALVAIGTAIVMWWRAWS